MSPVKKKNMSVEHLPREWALFEDQGRYIWPLSILTQNRLCVGGVDSLTWSAALFLRIFEKEEEEEIWIRDIDIKQRIRQKLHPRVDNLYSRKAE